MFNAPQIPPAPRAPAPRGRVRPGLWTLYVIGLGLVAFGAVALFRAAGQAPVRRLQADLPGAGVVTATLSLEPDPPRIGQIQMRLRLVDPVGAPVRADLVTATPRPRKLPGAILTESAPGIYEGTLSFPSVGDWELEVEVQRGSGLAVFRFAVKAVPYI